MSEAIENGNGCPIRAKIARVNEILRRGEPANTSSDYKGWTGYDPQSLVDAMNAAFDFGDWGFEEMENNEVESTETTIKFVSRVRVWLAKDGKKIDFQPTAWGEGDQQVREGGKAKPSPADARKSAQTDALKKALSYYSVGRRSYLGMLPKNQGK